MPYKNNNRYYACISIFGSAVKRQKQFRACRLTVGIDGCRQYLTNIWEIDLFRRLLEAVWNLLRAGALNNLQVIFAEDTTVGEE